MKLLIDGDIFTWQQRGGISRIYGEVFRRMPRLAPDVDLLVAMPRASRSAILAAVDGIQTDPIPTLLPDLRPWRMWRLLRPGIDSAMASWYWHQRTADVFHPTYFTTPVPRIPSFCIVYDLVMEFFPESFDPSYQRKMVRRHRRTVEQASVVLCISESTKRDVVRFFNVDEGKCRVMPLASFLPPLDSSGEVDECSGSGPFLLFVGDWRTPYKNFTFVLDCLASEEFADFRGLQLVVVSVHLPSREERASMDAQVGEDRIVFRCDCDDNELRHLYQCCSALIYPSLYEGFGLPVLEALAQGTPVACARTSSLPEVGGDVVHYFDPKSQLDTAEALRCAVSEGRSADAVLRRCQWARGFSWNGATDVFVRASRDVGGQ